ncbi:MAG: hypothetical protein M3220_00325 [Chloroflexota bacterium]|nr:hypothetical protein [Chloroflexota bacterium]
MWSKWEYCSVIRKPSDVAIQEFIAAGWQLVRIERLPPPSWSDLPDELAEMVFKRPIDGVTNYVGAKAE